LSVDRHKQNTPKARFDFAQLVRVLMRGKQMPSSRGSETERYFEHFRVTVSQMGMTYFQSYSIYEQDAKKALTPKSKAASLKQSQEYPAQQA